MPILDHFGLIAPLYERMMSARDGAQLAARFGFTSVPSRPAGLLLDAGGGTGRVSQGLLAYFERSVVIDESASMLAQARHKPGIWPARSFSEQLPFAENTFDYVLMVDALHHVANQAATAQELWRVCRPGGRIVIEEPDYRSFSVKLLALGEKLLLMRSHFLTPPQIQQLFSASSRIERDNFNAWVIVDKPVSA